jgi:hypothetical protein
MHQQSVFEHVPQFGSHYVAQDLFCRGLCLPSGPNLSVADLDWLVRVVRGARHGKACYRLKRKSQINRQEQKLNGRLRSDGFRFAV